MVIYKATNKLNGKAYIGQTVRPLKERIAEHARHNDTYFDKAIAKYGLENFRIEVIDSAKTIEELNQKEIFWICFFETMGAKGYNLCEGGGNTKGFHHTEESKKAMSEKKKEMYIGTGNPFYGKRHSAASREKMSRLRKNRELSQEWKEHISSGLQNKRKVRNIETGEVFASIAEAAEKYNIIPTHITRVCRGKRKRTGGFHWEYTE